MVPDAVGDVRDGALGAVGGRAGRGRYGGEDAVVMAWCS